MAAFRLFPKLPIELRLQIWSTCITLFSKDVAEGRLESSTILVINIEFRNPVVAAIAQVCHESCRQVLQECVKIPLYHSGKRTWVATYFAFGLNFLRLFHPRAEVDSHPNSLLPITSKGKKVDNVELAKIRYLQLIFRADDVIPFISVDGIKRVSDTFLALTIAVIHLVQDRDREVRYHRYIAFRYMDYLQFLIKGEVECHVIADAVNLIIRQ